MSVKIYYENLIILLKKLKPMMSESQSQAQAAKNSD